MTRIHTHKYDGDVVEIVADEFNAKVTGRHCFWVASGENLDGRAQRTAIHARDYRENDDGRWVKAENLKLGDVLLGHSGHKIVIEKINGVTVDTTVHNLSVEKVENYLVGKDGVLVHNVKP